MNKIKDLKSLIRLRKRLQSSGKKVVFTNGCFDLIHAGHIYLFRTAKSFGDILITAVNDDDSIRRFKGPSRPIFAVEERLEVLQALETIDFLTVFSQDTPLQVITSLRPDVLVKGGDWQPEEVVGRAEVLAWGGRVEIVPTLPGSSSTGIIDRVLQLSTD